MKQVLILAIIFFPGILLSQISNSEKHNLATTTLWIEADSLIKILKERKANFMIILNRDTLSDWYSSYRVKFTVDSCETDYIRSINEDFQINTVNVGYVQAIYRRKSDRRKCVKMFPNFQKDLAEYFLKAEPVIDKRAKFDFILLGYINGNWLLEQFNHDFVAEHHSGMLFQAIQDFGL